MHNYDIYQILDDLKSPRRKKLILDTDTYNEVDDQFAVSYSMLSQDKVEILGFTAAPFKNGRSNGPEDGMLKSYDELIKITALTDPNHNIPILKGSRKFLDNRYTHAESEACDFIIEQALNSDERIYVVAIGAITNVASALIKCPEIKDKLIVVWLATHAECMHAVGEFNMQQDVPAAQTLFDSEAPIILVPAAGCTSDLDISVPELHEYMDNKNELCQYLHDTVYDYMCKDFCSRKVIWDVGAVAPLILQDCMVLTAGPCPILTDEMYCYYDPARHPMITANRINRQAIFADMFHKMWAAK